MNNYKTYLCDYQYKDNTYTVEIKATSIEEARDRLRCIGRGEIIGELIITIPVIPKWNWLSRLLK